MKFVSSSELGLKMYDPVVCCCHEGIGRTRGDDAFHVVHVVYVYPLFLVVVKAVKVVALLRAMFLTLSRRMMKWSLVNGCWRFHNALYVVLMRCDAENIVRGITKTSLPLLCRARMFPLLAGMLMRLCSCS